uniref:Putative secreted protein n=1 Tax=Ixodes ricinus TaxID=34613 RepID=A0A6B0UNT6_IXORI
MALLALHAPVHLLACLRPQGRLADLHEAERVADGGRTRDGSQAPDRGPTCGALHRGRRADAIGPALLHVGLVQGCRVAVGACHGCSHRPCPPSSLAGHLARASAADAATGSPRSSWRRGAS